MTQGWERTLLEFYRRAEADEEEQMIATARQGQRADNEARSWLRALGRVGRGIR